MGTTVNELYLLTCLHIPAMKDLLINTVSVTVYQSTETQSHIININTFSINNQKKYTYNSLMTFIGSKQSFMSPKNYGSFLLPVSHLQSTLFSLSSQDLGNSHCSKVQPQSTSTQTKYHLSKSPHIFYFFLFKI